jgi:type I restriction enzyme S subunit
MAGENNFKDTPLGPLTEEWGIVPLEQLLVLRGEVVQPQNVPNLRYIGLEHLDPGISKLLRWGTTEEVKSTKAHFYNSDILYGKLRPYLDKAALAEWEGVCSTDILVFKHTSKTVADFMVHVLHTKPFIEHAIATTSGVNHPRTSWNSLRGFQVLLPSLPEQRAIAHFLTTVCQAIEATERVIEATRQLKKSMMKHLFMYGYVPVEETNRTTLRETGFGSVPSNWDIRSLDECAYVQTGTAKGRKLGNSQTITVPYLRVANVQDGFLNLAEIKQITIKASEIDRYRLEDGDVLLTEGGDFDKLGRGFIWRADIKNCVHQNHIFAVRANRALLLPDYFAYLIQSMYGKAYFLKVAHRTTHLASINSTKLKGFPVLLPSLDEQSQIAKTLAVIDCKIQVETLRKTALEALFQSLLHHLMTGKVRVDNSIEP